MLFDNMRDAISRLSDTVVTYRGKAMFVEGITDNLELSGFLILGREPVVASQDDPSLNMACPEVGFVNTESGAHYFMRQPMRRWKQGIDFRALVCPYSGIRPRGLLTLEDLAKCLENVYPSFEEASHTQRSLNPFKQREELHSLAFCKTFSVSEGPSGLLLNYKGREVGVVERGNPVLAPKFEWLRESLQEAM
tara:strand:- start:35815 stop:36393 length:579 start_codon:yes stop_codon:yes gene_type:complete